MSSFLLAAAARNPALPDLVAEILRQIPYCTPLVRDILRNKLAQKAIFLLRPDPESLSNDHFFSLVQILAGVDRFPYTIFSHEKDCSTIQPWKLVLLEEIAKCQRVYSFRWEATPRFMFILFVTAYVRGIKKTL